MPYRPTRRQNTFPGTTPYRRRPCVEGARRSRPLFAQSRVARAGSVLARCKAALSCFGAAALALALALALPLTTSPSAAADVDLEARAAAEAAQLQAAAELPRSASLDVPALQQYPELPTGCESVALTNALLACGFVLQKTEMTQEWLPTSADDFVHAFMGDPSSPNGHSCMAPAIADAASAYLAAHGSSLEATDLTGAAFRDVLAQAAAGNPVVVWCTIGLDEPGACYRTAQEEGRTYRLVTNSHCVVVRGYDLDAGTVLVSDSWPARFPIPWPRSPPATTPWARRPWCCGKGADPACTSQTGSAGRF